MKLRVVIIVLLNFIYFNSFAQSTQSSIKQTDTIAELVVTGARNETDIRHIPMTLSVLGHKKIEEKCNNSLLPIISEQVPGIFITSRGIMGYGVSTGAAGGISLRGIGGGSASQMLVLIDGHPQYMGLFGHPIADAYQSMIADRVEVLRGPASVLYGSNAMGGVINIVTHKQQNDGINTGISLGYGSYNTFQGEAYYRVKAGKFSNITTFSYNRTDGHRDNMNFEQYSGYIKLGYNISKYWNMYTDLNITRFNASNPGAIDKLIIDNDSKITRGMASFSIDNNYNTTSGSLKLFYNWGRHNINDGYFAGGTPLDYRFNSKDKMFGVLLYQNFSLFKGNNLTIGVDYQQFGGDAWNKFINDGHKEDISDKSENEIAGYLDFRQSLGKYLTLNAGLRLDHHSITGNEFIPQAGISATLPGDVNIKAIIGKGFRNPTIKELYMFRPANPDLLPERLWNYELSFSQRVNTIKYGVSLYYLKGDNIIQVVRSDGRPLNKNIGKIENWGVEMNVAYIISNSFNINSNYSWLRMVYPVLASPEHKFFIGADYSKNKWSINTGIQYISGLYTDLLTQEKENFLLWNLYINYKLYGNIKLFIKGENLLAQKYEINAGFPMPRATFMGGIKVDF